MIGTIRAYPDQDAFSAAIYKIAAKLRFLKPPVVMLRTDDEPVLVLKLLRPQSQEDQTLEWIRGYVPTFVPNMRFTYATEWGNVMAQDAVIPYKLANGHTVSTLKDMLQPHIFSTVSRSEIRSFLRQIIYFLHHMQTVDPAFTHNDLKCDNVLLTTSPNGQMQIIIIDFETVSRSQSQCSGLGLARFGTTDSQTLFDFGLGLEFSPYTDLHLIFLEIWNKLNMLSTKQEWAYDFVIFSTEIFPLHFMQTWSDKGKYVTRFNRLGPQGRAILDDLRAKQKILSLGQALDHSFLIEE